MSHPALLKHEKRGTVKQRNADGLFDVDECKRSLAENFRPNARRAQHTEKPAATRPATGPVVAIRPTPAATVDEDEQLEQGLFRVPAGEETADISLLAIQRQRELIKLER